MAIERNPKSFRMAFSLAADNRQSSYARRTTEGGCPHKNLVAVAVEFAAVAIDVAVFAA